MSEDQSLQIIRDAFAHVAVKRIDVEYNPFVNGRVAKIFVREDQLDAALGDNGANARRAAMESGMNVEVALSEE